jgi:hypothetical protein
VYYRQEEDCTKCKVYILYQFGFVPRQNTKSLRYDFTKLSAPFLHTALGFDIMPNMIRVSKEIIGLD